MYVSFSAINHYENASTFWKLQVTSVDSILYHSSVVFVPQIDNQIFSKIMFFELITGTNEVNSELGMPNGIRCFGIHVLQEGSIPVPSFADSVSNVAFGYVWKSNIRSLRGVERVLESAVVSFHISLSCSPFEDTSPKRTD
jgi:hypothetical protein